MSIRPIKTEYDPWKVVESGFSPVFMAEGESVFALANGYIGIRGAFEEGTHSWNRGVYLNGFYEERPIVYGEKAYGFPEHSQTMLGVADASKVEIKVDGVPLNLGEGRVKSYRRELDMREGVLRRTFTWVSPAGQELNFSFERIVLLSRRRGAAIKITLELAGGRTELSFLSSLDGTRTTKRENRNDPRVGEPIGADAVLYTEREVQETQLYLRGNTLNSRLSCAAAAEHCIEGLSHTKREPLETEREVGVRFSGIIEAGERVTLSKYIAYESCSTDEEEEIRSTVVREAQALKESGFNSLLFEQAGYLCEFWERSDVEIEGDPALQQGIRFNIFHLLQSAGKDGRTSIAAKGLTGEGYEGHYFWDTEIYVLPFFIYTNPAIARKLLEYRCSILPRARERASELSQKGALFPWRTINGKEASAYYPAGTAQYHIDADIAYGVKRYLNASGDSSFLPCAAEILIETARMWYDLGWFNQRRGGAFCIDGVTGPDEYTALVNNNYYTNIMARDNLFYAAAIVERIRRESPKEYKKLVKKLDYAEEEAVNWRRAAKEMWLPYEKEKGIHPQDDSFLNKEVWPIESIPEEKRPLLLHYHPLVIYRHQVIKQADTVLALFLKGDEFSIAEKKRDFDYYDRLTTGDSSLSPCVQSIIASEVGYEELAYRYFTRTARIDLDDVNGNVRDGLHTAAMAGTWASIVQGFAGMRDYGGMLRFNPHLPREWKRLAFNLTLEAVLLEVTITHNEVAYTLKEGQSLTILHRGKEHTVYSGSPLVFSNRPDLEAVIFDLDGVITDSAEYHYLAWKQLAEELDIPFDREFNQNLKGVGRMDSLELILSKAPERSYTCEEKVELTEKKNNLYKELITQITPDNLLPGIESLLKELKAEGIYTALASASRNAPTIVENLKIGHLLDVITDPDMLDKGKPDPEQFFLAAEMLGVPARNCIGVEDAQAGIDAIRGAGMFSLGVGDYLHGADWTVSDTSEITLSALREQFYRHSGA
ncbi:MAG: beta-phosphoglucomutase [Spirochaetaceae bacterium]